MRPAPSTSTSLVCEPGQRNACQLSRLDLPCLSQRRVGTPGLTLLAAHHVGRKPSIRTVARRSPNTRNEVDRKLRESRECGSWSLREPRHQVRQEHHMRDGQQPELGREHAGRDDELGSHRAVSVLATSGEAESDEGDRRGPRGRPGQERAVPLRAGRRRDPITSRVCRLGRPWRQVVPNADRASRRGDDLSAAEQTGSRVGRPSVQGNNTQAGCHRI